jgi:hypothetical protein
MFYVGIEFWHHIKALQTKNIWLVSIRKKNTKKKNDSFGFHSQNKQRVHCNPSKWTTKFLHDLHKFLFQTNEYHF